MHVRGVAGDKDPADPKLLHHPNVRTPDRAPGQFAQPNVGAPRDSFKRVLQTVEGAGYARSAGADHEGVDAGGQRSKAEVRVPLEHPAVPVLVVEPIDAHIGQQHRDVVVGLADERHRELTAHATATAVGADQVRRVQGPSAFQSRSHAV
ncbi:MAG: hypothetical protein QOJ56_6765, partial [Mycobacterium sp.]|nr:hypothetical protein [Mycobacterium sp.]